MDNRCLKCAAGTHRKPRSNVSPSNVKMCKSMTLPFERGGCFVWRTKIFLHTGWKNAGNVMVIRRSRDLAEALIPPTQPSCQYFLCPQTGVSASFQGRRVLFSRDEFKDTFWWNEPTFWEQKQREPPKGEIIPVIPL